MFLERWQRGRSGVQHAKTIQRGDVLDDNGMNDQMVRRLLKDANLWIDLRRRLLRQATTIKGFCTEYANRNHGDHAIQSFESAVECLKRNIDKRLDKLDESTAILIQLVSRGL